MKILTFLFVILFTTGLIYAQKKAVLQESGIPVRTGIEDMLNCRFDDAYAYWDGLIVAHPDNPIGYYYKLITLQAQMVDYEAYDNISEFDRLADTLIKKVTEFDSTDNNYYENYFKGTISFYKANLLTRQGKTWSAFMESRSGADFLRDAIKEDSSYAEPFVMLGAYKYWKSRKAGILRKLLFMKDEREEGIRLIKEARGANEYVDAILNDQLAWIYIDTGQPTAALKLTRNNLEKFPGSRFFRWTFYHIELALKNESAAADILLGLHKSYRTSDPAALSNYLITMNQLLSFRNQETIKKALPGLIKNYKKKIKGTPLNDDQRALVKKINNKIDH